MIEDGGEAEVKRAMARRRSRDKGLRWPIALGGERAGARVAYWIVDQTIEHSCTLRIRPCRSRWG